MRETKFRIRNATTKEIVAYELIGIPYNCGYAFYFANDKEQTYHSNSNELVRVCGILCPIREQFTGFQDKNGRDVYEGDILENYHNQKFEIVYGLNKKEIVSHNSSQQKRRSLGSGFYEREIGKEINSYIILLDASWGKTIGNIYETPELIEVSK